MKSLTRLVYASRINPAVMSDLAAAVQEVLRVSRVNNRQAGVTGMLLTHAGFFVQALEGEDERVQATLKLLRTIAGIQGRQAEAA